MEEKKDSRIKLGALSEVAQKELSHLRKCHGTSNIEALSAVLEKSHYEVDPVSRIEGTLTLLSAQVVTLATSVVDLQECLRVMAMSDYCPQTNMKQWGGRHE